MQVYTYSHLPRRLVVAAILWYHTSGSTGLNCSVQDSNPVFPPIFIPPATHIIFVGDSVTRYQYLDLVYTLEHEIHGENRRVSPRSSLRSNIHNPLWEKVRMPTLFCCTLTALILLHTHAIHAQTHHSRPQRLTHSHGKGLTATNIATAIVQTGAYYYRKLSKIGTTFGQAVT